MPRPKCDFRSASRENYKGFTEQYPEMELSFDQFREIIYTNNRAFWTHILETGAAVPMPHGLGQLSVNKKKTQSVFTRNGIDHIILPVDWVKTRESGKKTYFYNDHTEGYRFSIIWFKHTTTGLKMKDIWAFKPAREWSRTLATYLKNKEGRYMYKYTQWITGRATSKYRRNAP